MGASQPLAVAVGLVAGYLSGQFGIGGGLITTPAIRLLLGYPALIAVGTPLPVVIPTAIAGAIAYSRRGLTDVRLGVAVGLIGGACAVVGAWATTLVGGDIVLILTAALICWMALDMVNLARKPEDPEHVRSAHVDRARSWMWIGALGVAAGLYSGFLGLGGGFVVVPALVRYFGFPIKRAVGTSLVALSLLAIPGTVAHYFLGNIDVGLAIALAIGVVPGALLGAHVTAMAREKSVRIGFAVLLLAVGVLLAASEMGIV
ncbi:MAG: sulfite exporter TauE/SafE family protein [Coriobacteriia bacterium]|nr:sulfite exporter TauE/SafE family protein [Coriobacteriia bacterium]